MPAAPMACRRRNIWRRARRAARKARDEETGGQGQPGIAPGRPPGQGEPELIGTAEKSEFIDTAARFGTPYEYFVQAFAKAGDAEAFSEQSTAVEVTPRDIFPPAPPAGLMATPGAAAIQLTWSPNSESDLAGYRVYRSAGGAFERVADALPTPFYADRDVKAGVSYRYSVSAFDQGGNESARTDPVEATAQ